MAARCLLIPPRGAFLHCQPVLVTMVHVVEAPSVSEGKGLPCLTNTTTLAFRLDRYGPDFWHVAPVRPCAEMGAADSGMCANSLA